MIDFTNNDKFRDLKKRKHNFEFQKAKL